MKDERQIAYLWVPEFGPSIARRVEPKLNGRPLVLLDEQGRVVVADAVATRAGVAAGVSERQASARCPEAVRLPAVRFPLVEAQERFLGRVRDYADRWQPDGLGRAYLDVTGVAAARGGAGEGAPAGLSRELLQWCQALSGAVRNLGWEPALGATGSKFGASVAGQAAWRNAALLLAPAAQQAFLAAQPVAALPLDVDALAQLRYLGIRSLGQFASLPVTGVLTRFGQAGRTAQRWAQGRDDRPVVPPWEAPELSTRLEFEAPLEDRDRLLLALMRRTEKLLVPMRDRLQATGRLALTVTRADGRIVPATHIFPVPTAAAEPVRLALAAALGRLTWDGQGAAEATLTLAGITDAPGQQLTLFDITNESRARLTAALDGLAARFGAGSFRLAALVDPDNPLPERRASLSDWTVS